MSEAELFKTFDNKKLIDIVKNYRQYKYEERLRSLALQILEERGITEEDLKLTGNNTNHSYDKAEDIYKRYNKLSLIAFVLYILWFTFYLLIKTSVIAYGNLVLAMYVALIIAYFIFIVRSFMEYGNFFKAIGKSSEASSVLGYYFIGMPFYIFMYFYYKGQMKEEMRMIS